MAYKEFDRVRVIRPIPAGRVDRDLSEATQIQVGDVGAVLVVHASHHLATAYTVECVGPRGEARWLAELFEHELEPVSAQASATQAQDA